MIREVSKYKNNSIASKKKHIYSRLLDYFSIFVVSYLLFTITYAIFGRLPVFDTLTHNYNQASIDAMNYVDQSHLQRKSGESESLISIEDGAKTYLENLTKTSSYVNNIKYPYKNEDGTYTEKDVTKEETFINNLQNYELDNLSYYYRNFKKNEPSLNSYLYGGVDYSNDLDTYQYLKIMTLSEDKYIAIDNENYIARSEGASRFVILNDVYTQKMINRIAKGETIDQEAVDLYNEIDRGYVQAVQYGIKDIEQNSAPYLVITENFKNAYRGLTSAIAIIYYATYIFSFALFMVIMRLISKEWVTLGQKVMGLAMNDVNEFIPSPLNIVLYNVINLILCSTTSMLAFYLTGLFGVMSIPIAGPVTLLWILLFILPLNIFSLFMPLFSKNHHDLASLASRLLVKDKNEFDAPVDVDEIVEEKQDGTEQQD